MNMLFPTNDSLPPHITSFNTSSSIDIRTYMYFIFTLTNIIFILPPTIFVLYLGHQRWRQQRSVSAAIISNSDFFTYNLASIELIGLIGHVICWSSNYAKHTFMIGMMTVIFAWTGQMLFPLVTCVDRYLAVVHPITYLTLRQGRGVRIRNITAMSIWVLGLGEMGFSILMINSQKNIFLSSLCIMVVCLIVLIFCSLSVLFVLIRPRPGEMGTDRMRVDKSKQRAFYTILIIMGVLLLRFGGSLVCYVISFSMSRQGVMLVSSFWFALPSSLVLPLLFLHRAGKLQGCKHNTESG